MKSRFLGAVCACLSAVSFNATAVTFYYTGEINTVYYNNSTDTSIVHGTPFSGFLSYDETLPDMKAEDWWGSYHPNDPTLNSISVSVGNTNLLKEGTSIVVYNDKETCYGDPAGCHYLDLFFFNGGDNVLPDYDLIQITIGEGNQGGPDPTLLSSDSLPISPLDLDISTNDGFQIHTPELRVNGYVLTLTQVPTPPVPVTIDIKPGSDPNSINLSAAGVIPVAILSTVDFDATTVEPTSVSLAGASVRMVGKSDKYLCHQEDVNNDGLIDLVCQIYTAQFMVEEGETTAILEAETFDGTKLRGEDYIRIVPDN